MKCGGCGIGAVVMQELLYRGCFPPTTPRGCCNVLFFVWYTSGFSVLGFLVSEERSHS